jgi:hypothetical protein
MHFSSYLCYSFLLNYTTNGLSLKGDDLEITLYKEPAGPSPYHKIPKLHPALSQRIQLKEYISVRYVFITLLCAQAFEVVSLPEVSLSNFVYICNFHHLC